MTISLTVDERAWRAHLAEVADGVAGLVPVVKGNGYGFGLKLLAREATRLAGTIAVGNIHEAALVRDAAPEATLLVLTPLSIAPVGGWPAHAVPTIGSCAHVAVLTRAGWSGSASLKLRSSMHRYGVAAEDRDAVADAAHRAGIEITSYVLHLPLIGDAYPEQRAVEEIETWLATTAPSIPMSVSHLSPQGFAELRRRHPDRRLGLRLGTTLWHGDRSFLRLGADVVDTRPVGAGTPAGYRLGEVVEGGTLVMIGAGSANGVAPLPDGRSPFHYAHRRLALVEAPHMHTSMVFVPRGEPCPSVGDRVDLQRPLTTTTVDEIVWA